MMVKLTISMQKMLGVLQGDRSMNNFFLFALIELVPTTKSAGKALLNHLAHSSNSCQCRIFPQSAFSIVLSKLNCI